jgi:hypothetical protein
VDPDLDPGSMPLMDPDPDPAVFVIDLQDTNNKKGFLLLLFEVHLYHFTKRSQKEVTEQ